MNINDRIRGIVSEHEEEFTDLVNQGKALPDTFHHWVRRKGKKQAEVTVEWQTPEGTRKCMTYKYQAFGIEDNGFQEVFVEEVIKESTRMGLYANIRGINHGTNKQGRIESLQPLTYGTEQRQAVIRFRNDWKTAYPRLINQLLRFPLTSEHDDVPDALEGAVQLARSPAQAGARPFLVDGGGY